MHVALFTQDTKVQALKRVPLFADLSRNELTTLAKLSEDLEVDAGKVLIREGDVGREFFVIVDGEVEVTKDGKRLRTEREGDFFGEIAILEATRRTATVTAKTPLRFFVLTAQGFRRVVEQSPGVERKVLRALARRVLALSDDPTL